MSALPTPVYNNAKSVVSYFRLIDSNRYFIPAISEILVDVRRTVHAERINNNRNIVPIHPSDVVIARTKLQSDKANGKVAKFCYVVRGQF